MRQYHEPLICSEDVFPEAGLSWEQANFGGCMILGQEPGLNLGMEFEHAYPSQCPIMLPLVTPVPAKWTMQCSFKSTWDRLPQLVDELRLPTIRRQTDIYVVERLYRGDIIKVLFVDGQDQGHWYDSNVNEDKLFERHTVSGGLNSRTPENTQQGLDESYRYSSPKRTTQDTSDNSTTTSKELSEDDLYRLLYKMETEPNKKFQWPTKAPDVITLYENVWYKEYRHAQQISES
jgi:hypothetical protein